jgi:hypothetical protein
MRGLVRTLWAIARNSRVDVGEGLRPGSGASALYLFLVLVFLLVGGVLLALGFDLDRVDAWLAGHATWFDLVGTILFKALLALLLLACVTVGAAGLLARWRRLRGGPRGDDFGWGAMILALIIGYFAAVGLFR